MHHAGRVCVAHFGGNRPPAGDMVCVVHSGGNRPNATYGGAQMSPIYLSPSLRFWPILGLFRTRQA